MDKIAFFLPARKGSERVKNKNTRSFAGIEGGLVENKIRQLLSTKHVDEIILSTNDEVCMEVAQKFTLDSRLRIVARPDNLCLSSTNLQDLICYVPTITDADHILWGGSVLPPLQASIIDLKQIAWLPAVNVSFILPFICFLVIIGYGYRTVKRNW